MEDKDITFKEWYEEITFKEWCKTADTSIPEWILEDWGFLESYDGPGPWPNERGR